MIRLRDGDFTSKGVHNQSVACVGLKTIARVSDFSDMLRFGGAFIFLENHIK